METVAATMLILMGMAIAGVWTRDILAGEAVDLSSGWLAARDPDSDTLFWPHWTAEYLTAAGAVAGGIGLLADTSWGPTIAGVAAGSLLYTSINSLGWALAQRERRTYAIPMLVGAAVGLFVVIYLLTR